MRKSLSVLMFALVLALAGEAAAATIRISDPRVELELAPGETYSGEFTAENPSEEEVKVRLYLEDWRYMPGGKGDKVFTPAGTSELSASKWITFTPSEETLKPFGRMTVRYTVRVPAEGVEGAYFSVLFLETALGTVQDEEGANVLVSGRIGALFFVRIKGTVRKEGRIEGVEIRAPFGNKPLEIVTNFANTGNTDITLEGNFLVMDADGGVQARGNLSPIYTFPGATETGTTQWVGRLPKGAYDVLLTYDLGKGQNLVEERTLSIE